MLRVAVCGLSCLLYARCEHTQLGKSKPTIASCMSDSLRESELPL